MRYLYLESQREYMLNEFKRNHFRDLMLYILISMSLITALVLNLWKIL